VIRSGVLRTEGLEDAGYNEPQMSEPALDRAGVSFIGSQNAV